MLTRGFSPSVGATTKDTAPAGLAVFHLGALGTQGDIPKNAQAQTALKTSFQPLCSGIFS